MKVKVDSLELSKAISVAMKFTSKSSADATSAILLTAVDNGLVLRTTTHTTNAEITVNAFDVEPGSVVINAQNFNAVIYDNEWVVLRDTKSYLHIEYDNTKMRIRLMVITEDDFPDWQEPIETIRIPKVLLATAASATTDVDTSGHGADTACVHISNHNERLIVFGADTIVGAMCIVEDESIDNPIALDSRMLVSVLQYMENIVVIEICRTSVNIKSLVSPNVFGFPLSITSGVFLGLIDQMFEIELENQVAIPLSIIHEISHVIGAAVRVDSASQMRIFSEEDNQFLLEIAGQEITAKSVHPMVGRLLYQANFYCKTFLRFSESVRDTDELVISMVIDDGNVKWVRISGLDVYMIICSMGGVFG